jgi:DNA repair exonuclease SbcCD ATPase subunit
MIIEKIELTGFGSYKNHTIVEIQQGITAIVASYDDNSKRSNAGGKTTIVMSILYAIYGEGEYNTLSELVNDKCDVMSVKLFFKLNGNEYSIYRGIQKKSSFLDFFENGNRRGKNIDDTQKEIISVMGMDYEMFSSSIFFEQNNMDKFIAVTADKRREYIDKVLGLEIWRNLGKEAIKTKKGFEKDFIVLAEERDAIKTAIESMVPSINQKSVIESELAMHNNKKTELNDVITKYNESYQNIIKLETIKSKIQNFETISSNLKNKLDTEKEKVFHIAIYDTEIKKIEDESKELTNQLLLIEKEHIKLNEEYDELNKSTMGFKLNISQINMEIENQKKHKNHALSGTCPTCKQIVDVQLLENENKAIDEAIAAMVVQLKTQQELLNTVEVKLAEYLKQIGSTGTEKNTISAKLTGYGSTLYKLFTDKEREVENEKRQAIVVNQLEKELEKSLSDMTALILEKDSIKVDKIDIDIKTVQNQVQEIDKIINGLNIKLGSIISEEKRKIELEEKLEKVKKDIDNTEKSVYIYGVLSESYAEIPKKLFLESVALIEEESNKLIQQVIPNINVKIYEDDKKKNNPLIIAFKENGNDRSYKRLSGGQKTVVNIAIRLAFSLVIMARAKTHLQFLCLDEPFGQLDSENRELIKGIFSMMSTFFKQIIIISHTDDINEFPNVLQVKKSVEGISYI